MTDLHPEDAKLVTLARSARGRTGAPEGAAVRDTDGRLVSLSRFLDVIGHELTHGVTQFTAR